MTDKELSKGLLNLDATSTPTALDSRTLTHKILARDRRRIRLLASLATLFWILATAGVIWLVSIYLLFVAPRLRAYGAGREQLENDWNDWAQAGDLAAQSVLACIIALLLAAVCTVLLILLSRRATLRQINANLLEISEQLKLSRQMPPSEPRAPTETA
jgi:ABC-type Fe3+ transport system permease subunit